ncbi:unnamed protein product [Cunninghamella blakesleeana]
MAKSKGEGKVKSGRDLNWRMNLWAAKLGEEPFIPAAKKAALNEKKKAAKKYNNDTTTTEISEEDIKKELDNMRKQKIETKVFHIRKEIKSGLKKAKSAEIQKITRKLKEAREGLASNKEDKEESDKKESDKNTHKKDYNTKDVERFESELNILKDIDMEALAEKTFRKRIQKNKTLNKDDNLNSILSSTSSTINEENGNDDDDKKTNIKAVEDRLLSSKILSDGLKKNIQELELIILGPSQKKIAIDAKRKAKAEASSETTKKRKTDETKNGTDSLFMDSLADSDNDDDDNNKKKESRVHKASDDWEDPDFDKYYNGNEKKNRPGQRQRRQKWLAVYGDDAKHVVEEKDKRKHQNKQNKQKPKSTPQSKDKNKQPQNPEEFHPSWQAKRQQQEMMSKALSGNAKNNNKIVFDDAD